MATTASIVPFSLGTLTSSFTVAFLFQYKDGNICMFPKRHGKNKQPSDSSGDLSIFFPVS